MPIRREIHSNRDMAKTERMIGSFPDKMIKEAHDIMGLSVDIFRDKVVERTPVGATSELRNSIFGEVAPIFGKEVVGRVGSPEIYTLPVEEGTKPHWAPMGALLGWVQRKLGLRGAEAVRVEFLVRRKIARVGTKGQHMFSRGWRASESRVRKLWMNMSKQATKRHFK